MNLKKPKFVSTGVSKRWISSYLTSKFHKMDFVPFVRTSTSPVSGRSWTYQRKELMSTRNANWRYKEGKKLKLPWGTGNININTHAYCHINKLGQVIYIYAINNRFS